MRNLVESIQNEIKLSSVLLFGGTPYLEGGSAPIGIAGPVLFPETGAHRAVIPVRYPTLDRLWIRQHCSLDRVPIENRRAKCFV